MGFKKGNIATGIVDFIHPEDAAIDQELGEDGEPLSDVDKYREDWDFDTHCALKEGATPTLFKINLSINIEKRQNIDNASIGGFGKKKEMGFQLGNHKHETVRSILVDIENPEEMPPEERIVFKRGKDGCCHDDTMKELWEYRVIEEIYSFYLLKSQIKKVSKKNNRSLLPTAYGQQSY